MSEPTADAATAPESTCHPRQMVGALIVLLALLGATLGAGPCGSQTYLVHSYTVDDGLPGSEVFAAEEDSLGRMWFATRGGLVVFDGVEWTPLPHLRAQPFGPSIRMALDSRGRMWIVSSVPGAQVAMADTSSWHRLEAPEILDLALDPELGLAPDVAVTALAVTEREGRVLVAIGLEGGGMLVGNEAGWTRVGPTAGLPAESIRYLSAREGVLTVVTASFMCEVDGPRVTCTTAEQLAPAVAPLLAAEYPVPAGSRSRPAGELPLWVLGGRGLLRIDDSGVALAATGFELDSSGAQGTVLLATDRGCIYFGQQQSLFHFDEATARLESLDRLNGLVANGATSLALDREGDLWVACHRGVSCVVSQRFATLRQRHGLLEDEVTAIAERAGGEMVLGHNSGISLVDGTTVRRLPFAPESTVRSAPPRVMDLEVDDVGRVWVAGSELGLGELGEDGSVTWHRLEIDGRRDPVFALLALADGSLMVGSGTSLLRYSEGRWTSLPWPHKALGTARRLELGPDGRVLVATSRGGLVAVDDGRPRPLGAVEELAEVPCYTVYRDRSGRVWVGTVKGLAELRSDRLQRPPEAALLITRPVYMIVEDHDGQMWYGTDDGVVRFDGREATEYHVHDGLAGRETNRAAGFVDTAGRLWIGTDSGVSVYRPDHDRPHPPAPRPEVLGVETESGDWRSDALELGHDANTVVFHFGGVSFQDRQGALFRARLDPFDHDWSAVLPPHQRSLRYTNLPKGQYRFLVQARTSHGGWSEPAASAPVVVRGPFWSSWWFLVASLASTLLVVTAAVPVVSRWRYARSLELEVVRRRAAEERTRSTLAELEESRTNFAAIVEEHNDGILVVDHDNRVRFANRAACALLVRTRFELEDQPWVMPAFSESGEEILVRRRSGESGLGEIRFEPTTWQGDRARLVTIRDVTESRHTEAQLRQAQKLEAVGQLAGGVAHDFNNLLQAMLSSVESLRMERGNPGHGLEAVDELASLVQQGAALTRHLLLFSRRDPARQEVVDINLTIQENLSLLRRLIRENVRFSMELAGEELLVSADRGQMSQVLTNLVVNACDAMPEGGRLTIRTGRDAAERVWFEVEDSGSGIPEKLRSKIFEPFFTTKDRHRGTGLGLSVVHGIVKQHGGLVEAESRTGQGSRFRVTLPAASEGSAAAAAEQAASQGLLRGNGERILLVEDDHAIRSGLARILRRVGYSVVEAASGEEVDRLPADAEFELLLCDMVLPGRRGDALARELRLRWPELAVVIMSGYSDHEMTQMALQAEAASFLHKPFDMERLTAVLREALDPESSGTRTVVREAPRKADSGPRPAILLVEDNEVLRRLITTFLTRDGYRVEATGDGDHAASLLAGAGHGFSLVISDLELPGLSGVELLERTRAAGSGLPFILCTGDAHPVASHPLVDGRRAAVLPKPFGVAELSRTIDRLLRSLSDD